MGDDWKQQINDLDKDGDVDLGGLALCGVNIILFAVGGRKLVWIGREELLCNDFVNKMY